ncbi:phosphate transporter [Coprinopsis sp. MPI-PUGE-AT-0042]|nr:phosphate transporter [Coprinopsis sp. MPI-PUGE-AT-0042]
MSKDLSTIVPPQGTASSPPRARLEEVDHDTRPSFVLNYSEVKLLGIAGVGFFLDAYDLFIINPVATMLQYRLYGGQHLPAHLEGFVKAGANIGSVIGQFAFGYAADALGRKKVYGKELMLIIFATIMTLTTPTGQLSSDGALIYLAVWRIILGIGVGGDYPWTMLTYIFSMQGWGSFAVWRIVVGISLIPAFGTLYQRLTLPESTRFEKAQKLDMENRREDDEISKLKDLQKEEKASTGDVTAEPREVASSVVASSDEMSLPPDVVAKKPAHFTEFYHHSFYGINLNQNVVLQQIGFDGKEGTPWEKMFKVSTGNMIITALGFVPGYYATVLTIETLGRKWIQMQGFLMAALFLAILAGLFETLTKVQFIVCFAFLQFFFNFGANSYVDMFPTRYKAFAHGISAASGKAGAIISALAFNSLSKKIGTPLAFFFACCIAGAGFTLLLPEVKGRDPDLILAEEIAEKRRAKVAAQ